MDQKHQLYHNQIKMLLSASKYDDKDADWEWTAILFASIDDDGTFVDATC